MKENEKKKSKHDTEKVIWRMLTQVKKKRKEQRGTTKPTRKQWIKWQ